MDERIVLARQATAAGEIQLQQRRLADGTAAYEIIVDGVFLMASYNQASERALARQALAALRLNPAPAGLRLLVGGLGMGFTLQEALAAPSLREGRPSLREDRPAVTAVDVVELSPWIIAWNQTIFASLNGHALADPRVRLYQGDVGEVVTSPPTPPLRGEGRDTSPPTPPLSGEGRDTSPPTPPLSGEGRDTPSPFRGPSIAEGRWGWGERSYAAILLDVDNGPSWLAHEANARLYTAPALAGWAGRLAPGGVLAVWSAQPEPEFLARLRAVFAQAEEVPSLAPAEPGRAPVEHFIYLGRKG